MYGDQRPADLQKFLCKEVAALCDADPEVLAKYIIRLMEEPEASRKSLEDKLFEFFGKDTNLFLDRLYRKLYGEDTDNASESQTPAADRPPSSRYAELSDEEDDGDRNFKHRRQRNDEHRDSGDERPKRRLSDQAADSNKHHRGDSYRKSGYGSSHGVTSGSGSPYYEQRNRYDRGEQRPSRRRCRDYHEKGFCMRGDNCPYDHGSDRIIVDEGKSFGAMQFPRGVQPPFFNMPPFGDAYDPEQAYTRPNGYPDGRGGMQRRGRGRGRGGHFQQNRNRQNRTLIVENIPADVCDIAKINDFFSKFGTIVNINVRAPQQKAILQFSTHEEADTAYKSPDPIFDNRFIKVYWQKEKEENAPVSDTADPATSAVASESRAAIDLAGARPGAVAGSKRPSNEPDPEVVAAHAAELAKIREKKQKEHQERMMAVLELQKQKEKLLQSQIDEQKRLLAKLSDTKNMDRTEKEKLLQALKQIAANIDASKVSITSNTTTTTTAPTTATATETPSVTEAQEASDKEPIATNETQEELKQKLARLENEAKLMGISPETFKPYPSGGARGGRGGYYGRGRGGWSRPYEAPRFKLDNRPTKILIKPVAEDIMDDVRKHFEQFGTFKAFETKPEGVVVEYHKRFEAENAMNLGTRFPKQALELAWYTTVQSTPGPTSVPKPDDSVETLHSPTQEAS